MKKLFFLAFLLLVSFAAFYFRDLWKGRLELVSPLGRTETKPKTYPLAKYDFGNLRKRTFEGSQIKLEKVIKKEAGYTSYLFSYKTDGKRVTGLANIPAGSGPFPVVVMVRGQVDDEVYFTGAGTYKAAGVFAQNGFITLAPDFLGFGSSETSSADILEARFERPIAILELLSSIKTLKEADPLKIAMWGHSNGGQIALSVLEITQKPIPSTLWAPVTKGFPESVLTYIGEMNDQGLIVKTAIDNFLKDYDPKKYSIDNYFGDITAPIQLHQGTADALVPLTWSDTFILKMESLGKKVEYHKYRGNDHNLKQSWDLVVKRDLEFFRKNLK
ncbi:MAG: prolyl oligopeptidase family serine peptidase [bacterium]|nr:prolyl oligopeptidase family serine peptidase [bacterium]